MTTGTYTGGGPYPEHEKLMQRDAIARHIEHFLQWIEDQGLEVFESPLRVIGVVHRPCPRTPQQLVADYCRVDFNKLESERREMMGTAGFTPFVHRGIVRGSV